MDQFLQTVKDGLAIGSLYALIALGYTMVYGILKFINFAHSDIVVLGAWTSLTLSSVVVRLNDLLVRVKALTENPPEHLFQLPSRIEGVFSTTAESEAAPWWLGGAVLITAMAICGAVGFTIERLAYKPLRSAPRLNVLITAIGVSLLLQNVGQLPWAFGTRPMSIPALVTDSTLVSVGQVNLTVLDVVGVATAVALMLGLEYLVFHTKLGRAMRAVSHSTQTAALMGIPVNKVISFTFILGSSLAAAGGFLWALKYSQIKQPADTSWVLLGLKAFVAAVVGGIGNVRGAMLGGLAIGMLEMFGAAYGRSSLTDVYVFGLLILVLMFRPGGILGSAVVEKV